MENLRHLQWQDLPRQIAATLCNRSCSLQVSVATDHARLGPDTHTHTHTHTHNLSFSLFLSLSLFLSHRHKTCKARQGHKNHTHWTHKNPPAWGSSPLPRRRERDGRTDARTQPQRQQWFANMVAYISLGPHPPRSHHCPTRPSSQLPNMANEQLHANTDSPQPHAGKYSFKTRAHN